MSEEPGAPPKTLFDKGDRAAIRSGRKGGGVRGKVFWVGENKYGSGMRYGLRGDDGDTYWVDEADLISEDRAPDPPAASAHGAAEVVLDRGQRVKITKGKDAGATGEIFWIGESRYGAHMRYGVKGQDEQTFWVDAPQVEAVEVAVPPSAADRDEPPSLLHDLPEGLPDELPPEAHEHYDEEEDVPF